MIDSLKISNEPITNISFQPSEVSLQEFQTPKKKSISSSSTPFKTPMNSSTGKISSSTPFKSPNVSLSKESINEESNEMISKLSNDINDFRTEMHSNVTNIQMEMIRQSFNQEQTFKLVEVLLQEIQDLKKEVEKLKKK